MIRVQQVLDSGRAGRHDAAKKAAAMEAARLTPPGTSLPLESVTPAGVRPGLEKQAAS